MFHKGSDLINSLRFPDTLDSLDMYCGKKNAEGNYYLNFLENLTNLQYLEFHLSYGDNSVEKEKHNYFSDYSPLKKLKSLKIFKFLGPYFNGIIKKLKIKTKN